MTQTVAARKIKLADLKERYQLQYTDDASFFTEWQDALPSLSESEQQALDRVKRNYLYLLESPVMESIVKMVVLSPMLDLAGFYAPPFRVDGETLIQVSAADEGETIQGSIDVLVLQDKLWVTVIEAKNSEFSITKAIPQTLAYMLAAPTTPAFGMVVNGSEFLFLKVIKNPGDGVRYSRSNLFSLLNQGNNLYNVLQVLKHLGQLAISANP
ncbi:type I restriction endonuclease [Leptothoe kymatousa]|uniref:Restriction endonuclease subunit R n=1 Tax=Leptothoe kymatousa TAU-MAC 1615 TaxID=2364775 RepID=A0ABS5Y1N2_9CYAN|nr:type I restriction endonuclease [Leptothoe kymatousa]MBT9311733.1 restriction endonuclease subunit R [Leptothoe kymatousa TAU-MAC 1615]